MRDINALVSYPSLTLFCVSAVQQKKVVDKDSLALLFVGLLRA